MGKRTVNRQTACVYGWKKLARTNAELASFFEVKLHRECKYCIIEDNGYERNTII